MIMRLTGQSVIISLRPKKTSKRNTYQNTNRPKLARQAMIVNSSNEQAWQTARLKGLGASEAAAALGISPYKSNIELWREKTGRAVAKDISDKDCVKFGKAAEKYIRELFALDHPQYKVEYSEFGMYFNCPKLPFAFATLDGDLTEISTNRKGVLEIKTSDINRSTDWQKWDKQIPDYYYIQILHQLLATGYDFVILKARLRYQKDGEIAVAIRHYHIERSEVLQDLKYLAEKEKQFWHYVETGKEPPLILPEI